MFTEGDPVPAIAMPEWQQLSDDEWARRGGDAVWGRGSAWGATTYVGPRRYRPDRPQPLDRYGRPIPTRAPSEAEPAPWEQAAGPTAPEAGEETNRRVLASSRTMAVASLVSRITGFLRSTLLVAALGVAGVGNAYNLANNLPNQVYELLLGGVLSSVLIPLLVHAEHNDDDNGMAYTQRLMSVSVAALAVVTGIAIACSPLLASAFAHGAAQRSLTSTFAMLLLPEIFFYGLGAMFTAVLNIRRVYGPGAWAPVFNNLIVILSVLIFWTLPGPTTLNPSTMTTTQVLVIGIGTTLGIAGQALILIPSLRRSGFVWKWRFKARPNEAGRMREAGTLTGWVLGYVVASQVGVTVIAKVGVARDGFAQFTNVDLLFQMPYGILVVSLLTALMPRLSRAAARGDTAAVVSDLGLGARLSAIALVPISVGFIALGPPFTTVLFAYGNTSIPEARVMGYSLAWSAFGLLPFAVVMLQLRVFYAMRDGRTPTLINIFMVAAKVALVLIADQSVHNQAQFIEWLNGATSISYLVGAIVGHVLLTRRFGGLGFGKVAQTVSRVGIASMLGGAAAWAAAVVTQNALGRGHTGSLVALIGGALVGVVVLAVILWQMHPPELREIAATMRR
ncbi:MAG: murein biosynthesis integral membrane protein MurJ [Actinomycetia bacterium]|nr:murein biosynthesis integral membrane protein MurJ [Actinomycetes bacterium]